MNYGKSVAVVLFQLGGPDSLEAIEPFLLRLFRDPDIIDFPFAKIAREPLARIISSTRAKKVRNHYAEIGGKSPILEFTQRQARALEDELSRFVKNEGLCGDAVLASADRRGDSCRGSFRSG